MRFLASTLATAILLTPTFAIADWQYTQWGMTIDQVLAASQGRLQRCDPKTCDKQSTETTTARLFGDYRAGEFDFTSFAYFDNAHGKLAVIKLRLKTPTLAPSLIGTLRTKYGEPANRSKSAISDFWVWRDSKDQVSLYTIGSGPTALVNLTYQPRITESNKGL